MIGENVHPGFSRCKGSSRGLLKDFRPESAMTLIPACNSNLPQLTIIKVYVLGTNHLHQYQIPTFLRRLGYSH